MFRVVRSEIENGPAEREGAIATMWNVSHMVWWAIIQLWEQGVPMRDTMLQESSKAAGDREVLVTWEVQAARHR